MSQDQPSFPRRSSQQARLLFLAQSMTLAANHQGATVMQEPVEDRGGKDLVAEDGAPLRDDLVRSDEQAAAFVSEGDELEKADMRWAPSVGRTA